MFRKTVIRFGVFVVVIYTPFVLAAINLALNWPAYFSLSSDGPVILYILWALTMMITAYAVWRRSPSALKRFAAIDAAWMLTVAPFVFLAGFAGAGLAVAENGQHVSAASFYSGVALYAAGLLLLSQIVVAPWILLTTWVMRKIDRKWFA
jgi:hypothetical protein